MGNNRGRRRRFGAVRELRSGQWQARYRGPDGLMRPADHTFPSKTDAEVWLTSKEAEILDGDWIDPDAGRVPFPEYAAVERVGMTGVHFHDLRHTGNMFTADAGANLRELMDRMGHASSRAAMIYLHSTDERQRRLADAVGELARAELRKTKQPAGDGEASGTKVARRRGSAS